MIELYFKDVKKEKLEKIKDVKDGCWINIENAKEEDLEYVAKLTGLDMPDLDDVLDPYELPRIEREGENIIIFVRDAQEENKEDIYTSLLTLIVTPRYFFTISPSKNKIINSMIDKGISPSTTQRSKMLISILLLISKNFTKQIKKIRTSVFYQKKKIDDVESLDIVELIKNEEIVNQYISVLFPMRNVFEAIGSGGYVHLYSYDTDLLEDMIISIKQSADICSVSEKSIRSLRESYQAIFTNRLNKTIRLLTSFTIILTVPTIIASIYGMNIGLPFQENPLAFLFILALIFLISSVFFIIFYVNKWL
ncbi:MAG: magnesium transporter CorA family protein [Candidatus Pacebacteria bacterium]|nr:magnesium transporter CorA family protein [Candidatus Paceibacterota bacterium]MDD5012930.1 magnesium transporter CorA family protein [Candidatus Paceibacterota bacterium]MDD5752514.1 magnesium transporter CorA family protein [Candidatus Paceibacterota bacterium]